MLLAGPVAVRQHLLADFSRFKSSTLMVAQKSTGLLMMDNLSVLTASLFHGTDVLSRRRFQDK